MNISLCEHKSGPMLQAVKQSLTWVPETFDALAVSGFGQFFIVSGVLKKLSSALSKFKCLAAKYSCLNPLWTYFPVTCPRMDPNDGITARGWAWMSQEETVVGCLYTDVAKTSMRNFRRVRTSFYGELAQARTILLFSSYSDQIFTGRNLLIMTCRRK